MSIAGPSIATRTSVTSAQSDTSLLDADGERVAAMIFNNSSAILYVGFGTTAVSPTDHSVQIAAGGYLTVPAAFVGCAIRGYWAAANGSARITVG